MDEYDKDNETKAEYIVNREKRIKKLCHLAEVSYEDYIKALSISKLGYSVVLQRDLDEIYNNPYNIEWLRAWDGNMDIQVVLDYFAVITYVTDYYSKDDTGTMEIIKATLAQTDSKDLKERMKVIANTFLTHRQMGEAEAIYRLLTSMLLKKCDLPMGLPRDQRRKILQMEKSYRRRNRIGQTSHQARWARGLLV